MSDQFSKQEQTVLSQFVTNLDQDTFVLINLPEVVKGALFSRYSRSPKSVRRLLLDEFINADESGFKEIVNFDSNQDVEQSLVARQKAEEFYDRVLVGYGDDSVAELASVHIAVENVSQIIAAKALEDNRLGISPLEKSTRYVRYDDKVDGQYRYYREPALMKTELAELYTQTNDLLFDTYSDLVAKMTEWIQIRYPKDADTKKWVYDATIRAKACDICRQLLPISTLTNVGLQGNGRAFEYLIVKMSASDYPEVKALAKQLKAELDKVIPSFVKRATNHRGEVTQQMLRKRYKRMRSLVEATYTSPKKPFTDTDPYPQVRLIRYEQDGQDRIIAGMLYEYLNDSIIDIDNYVDDLSDADKQTIIDAYCQGRENRHHKPGRALELTDYIFEITADIGTYKDLQRHRVLTPLKQLLVPDYGYEVPNEIIEAGYEKQYRAAMDQATQTYRALAEKFPMSAQYVLPLGYRCQWIFKLNLREVGHLTELRSQKQGHPYYRIVAQKMAQAVESVHPIVSKYLLQYVDYETVKLERLESEKRTDQKRTQLKTNPIKPKPSPKRRTTQK